MLPKNPSEAGAGISHCRIRGGGSIDAGVVPKTGRKDWPVLGTIGEMKEILERESVDEIMACLPIDSKIEEISQVTGYARDLGW